MWYPDRPATSSRRRVLLAGILLMGFGLSAGVEAANRKDEMPLQPAVMSAKAAKALLTDVSVFGNRIVVVGERGHALSSTDEGRSWVQGNVPVQVLLTSVCLTSEQQGWAVGHEGVILHTRDGGANWEIQYANPYKSFSEEEMNALSEEEYEQLPRYGAPLLDLWCANDSEAFAVGAYGMLLHTRDGGANWEDWSGRLDNADNWHLNTVGSADGKTLYVAGEKGVMFSSSDAGSHWSKLASPYEGSFFGMLTGPQPGQVMVFGLQGNLFRSPDAGASWQQIRSPTENSLMSGLALNPQDIILVGNSGTILISKDGGSNFSLQTTKDRQGLVGIAKTASGKVLMVGQGGVRLASPSAM